MKEFCKNNIYMVETLLLRLVTILVVGLLWLPGILGVGSNRTLLILFTSGFVFITLYLCFMKYWGLGKFEEWCNK